jgi:hypothetical protein
MTVEGLSTPLADSRDISYWFCEVYPKLLPEQYRSKIQDFLSRIHGIEGISLTAKRPEEPEKDLIDPACGRILARTDITPEYRRAVEFKDSVYVYLSSLTRRPSLTTVDYPVLTRPPETRATGPRLCITRPSTERKRRRECCLRTLPQGTVCIVMRAPGSSAARLVRRCWMLMQSRSLSVSLIPGAKGWSLMISCSMRKRLRRCHRGRRSHMGGGLSGISAMDVLASWRSGERRPCCVSWLMGITTVAHCQINYATCSI